MINLIGGVPDVGALLRIPGAHVHVYGKAPRPNRKVGHVTVVADDPEMLSERVALVDRLLFS